MLFNYDTLCALKKILSDFSVFSGLKCNIEKTMLMQVGAKIPIPPNIIELGFNHVDLLKSLAWKSILI